MATCDDAAIHRVRSTPRLSAATARRRAGDAAGALLRPRLRPRDHPVHGADGPPPDLVGAGPGPARARHALVGLGRLRLADQRHRPRGGRGPARHLRRDGGAADRLALRAGGLRRPRRSPSPSPTASSASPTSASSCSPAPTTTPCATRCSASPPAPRSRSSLLAAASLFDGLAQGALWALALFLDMGGPYFFGSEGWRLVPEPLRRAPRPDRDHRPRRVDRRDRRRRRRRSSTSGSAPPRCSASPWPRRCGGSTSTSSRSSPAGGWPTPSRAGSRTRWPATPTPTCTCRWSPGSSSSPSG